MSLDNLVKASDTKKGAQLKSVLVEIEKREGPQVFQTLAIAAARPRDDVIVVCFSGRGDKDCYEVARLEGEEL